MFCCANICSVSSTGRWWWIHIRWSAQTALNLSCCLTLCVYGHQGEQETSHIPTTQTATAWFLMPLRLLMLKAQGVAGSAEEPDVLTQVVGAVLVSIDHLPVLCWFLLAAAAAAAGS